MGKNQYRRGALRNFKHSQSAKVIGIDPVQVQRFDQDVDTVVHKHSNGLAPDRE
jgi:hypothetical protein